jgi:hypothetical protein
MSTSSATNSSSTKAARNASYEALVDGFEAWEKSELIIFLMKDVNKSITKTGRAKRAPKVDEDGNIVKRELNPGAKAWNEFVGHIKSELQDAYPDEKISHKACLRLGSILKEKAEIEGDENPYYPIENLRHEVLIGEWDEWNSLTEEEKFPPKEPKAKKGKKASAAAETDAEEEVKEKKPRGRPSKKTVAALDESEAEEEKPKPKAKAKKAAAVSDSEAETVSSKKSKTKAKAVVEDSEVEEVKPKAVKKAKAPVEDSEAEVEPKAVVKKAAKKTKGE